MLDELLQIAKFERYVPPGRLAGKAVLSDVSGCYVIEHVKTGLVYIGSTISLAERVRHNLVDAENGKHSNRNMQAIYQPGDELHAYIATTATRGDAYTLEQIVVEYFHKRGLALNIGVLDVMRPTMGVKLGVETRAKMSVSRTGKIQGETTKQKIREWNLGRKHTPEACAKISCIQKERYAGNAGHLLLASEKQSIAVDIDGKRFSSIRSAARHYDVNDSTISRRCRSPNFKNYTFVLKEN